MQRHAQVPYSTSPPLHRGSAPSLRHVRPPPAPNAIEVSFKIWLNTPDHTFLSEGHIHCISGEKSATPMGVTNTLTLSPL